MSYDLLSEAFGGAPLFDNSPFYKAPVLNHDVSASSSWTSTMLSIGRNILKFLKRERAEFPDERHLVAAILALKSGDYASARNTFNLIRPDADSSSFSCEHLAYRSLLERLLLEPAIAVYGTNIGDMAAVLDQCSQINAAQALRQAISWYSAIEEAGKSGQRLPVTELQDLEVKLMLNTFLLSLHLYGATASHTNRHYPIFRVQGPLAAQQSEAMQRYLSNIEQVRLLADKLQSHSALKHIDLLDLTNEACQNGELPSSRVDPMMDKYSNDPLMRGRLAVLRADSILSPTWSSPVLLNLCPVLLLGDYADGSLWSVLEDNMRLVDSETAQALYNQAQQEFERARCPYGLASLYLRRACLLYGVRATTRQRLPRQMLEDARALLDTSFSAFEGNLNWQLITDAHRLILAVLSSELDKALHMATDIQQRAVRIGNTRILRLIAIFLLRFGRRQAILFARTDVALACWSCVSILGQGYLCDIIKFVSLNWKTCLYDEYGNSLEAYISFKQNHDHFTQLFERLDLLNISEADIIATVKGNILISYKALASAIFNQIRDHPSLLRWNEQLRILMQDQRLNAYISSTGSPVEGYDKNLTNFLVSSDRLDQVDAAREKWTVVYADYRAILLTSGDIPRAKAIIRTFINHQGQNEAARLFVTVAYRILGEYENMRSMLGWSLDPAKINFGTHTKLGHGQRWSRSTSATQFDTVINCDNALAQCVMAHGWARGEQMLNGFERDVKDYLSFDAQKNDRGYRLGHAGLILEHARHPNLRRAFGLLNQARKLVIEAQTGTSDPDRQIASADMVSVSAFYQGLARICLKLKAKNLTPLDPEFLTLDLPDVDSFDKLALLYLEDAKAKSVGQSLQDIDNQSDGLSHDPAYEKRLARVLGAIPTHNRTAEEDDELIALVQTEKMTQQVTKGQLHQLPSTDEPSLNEHLSQVPEDALLIVTNYSDYGKVWFGVTSSGIEVAGYNEEHNLVQIRDYTITVQHRIKTTSQSGSWAENSADLQETLDYLSREMLSPFSELLATKQHIIFSASFPMSGFPFSILPYNAQPLFLSKSISLTPSLAAFAQLHARQPGLQRTRVGLVTRPATPAECLRTHEKPLPQTAIEALSIASLCPSGCLKPTLSSTMSREALIALLATNDIVHIGTHGTFDARSPWLSSISLAKQLRVLDLAGVRSRCGLVVLAACESGVGERSFIEEAIGFGHVVLSGCANAFLGSLWEVNDVGTMLLMVSFYRELWACEAGTALAEVLRRAQCRLLRCATAGRVREELEALKGCVRTAREMGIDVDAFVKDPDRFLNRDAGFEHGFSHPFYWASFVLMGNGAARVYD